MKCSAGGAPPYRVRPRLRRNLLKRLLRLAVAPLEGQLLGDGKTARNRPFVHSMLVPT